MVYIQKWKKGTFEYWYLKKVKKCICKKKENIYIGFDYGFFKGMNIYYKDKTTETLGLYVKEAFEKEKVNIRLFTNYQSDFDVILLLGYSNLLSEKIKLINNYKKIKKALTSF